MIEHIGDLRAIILEGTAREHRHANLECKQSWSQDVGKDISALGNKTSLSVAWIAIGVGDDGKAVKRDEAWAHKTEQELSSHLHQYLDPFQTCVGVEAHEFPTGWVVIIQVVNPGAVVYWNCKAYKLVGTQSREMEPDERMQLTLSLPGLYDFSRAKCITEELHSDAVSDFVSRIAKRDKSGVYNDLPAMGAAAALRRLGIDQTQTSRILFGQIGFRKIFYDAAGNVLSNDTIRPLYRIFGKELRDEIERFGLGSLISDRSIECYPIAAYQEALANAVAHAAYFDSDGDIMVEVFPSKLCISNLCTRESAYFANRWFSRNHHTANKLLMESLRTAGHVDELGRGKSVIFGDYILTGREIPYVSIERVHRYSRWRLSLPGKPTNERHLRLLEKIRAHYGDEQKARIALALALWRNKPVAEIRNFIDGEYAPLFAEVLSDIRGATFYWEERDTIVLNRWARLLLQEGIETRTLSDVEEQHLFRIVHRICPKFHAGIVTPSRIRELAELGTGNGAATLSSRILNKWESEGRVRKVSRGIYKLVAAEELDSTYAKVLDILKAD